MIIAEASLQHEGSPQNAAHCAEKAKEAGADAIKFQLFVPGEELFCPLEGDDNRWPKWIKSVMKKEEWAQIKNYCDHIGIDFMASVFQHKAVELYKSLKPKWWKVASRAVANFPYEEAGGPFIISTGLCSPNSLVDPVKYYTLQCRVEYPHPPEAWSPAVTYGLSDHSGSPWPSIHALARGAEIIEVHVDFGRKQKLPEEISLDELKLICEARDAFAALR